MGFVLALDSENLSLLLGYVQQLPLRKIEIFLQRDTRGLFPLPFYIGQTYVTIVVPIAKRFAQLKKHIQPSPARCGYVLHLPQQV